VIQCSRQQVVIANASDIATYFEEQMYMGRWYRAAAEHLLNTEPWDLFMFKWHGPDWTNHLAMYMIDPRHAMYDPDRAEEGWAYWDRLMGLGDEIVRTVVEAAGEDALVALVSDHGGNTNYGGPRIPDVNALLEAQGLLVRGAGGVDASRGPSAIDWTRTRAYCLRQYVYLNTVGRTPHGLIEPGSEAYHALRAQLIETLLDLKDDTGRHAFQAVLPTEDAARLGIAGSFAGDLFLLPRPQVVPTRDEFYRLHPAPEKSGTWDWPKLNSGGHSDDSYLILSGPGVKQGYRRPRPTWINSVAPTLATAAGLPVPRDADGTILQDVFE
jgi:predicted AlkP superfamily phosphohydrolase/phosphomutase